MLSQSNRSAQARGYHTPIPNLHHDTFLQSLFFDRPNRHLRLSAHCPNGDRSLQYPDQDICHQNNIDESQRMDSPQQKQQPHEPQSVWQVQRDVVRRPQPDRTQGCIQRRVSTVQKQEQQEK